MLAKLSAGVLIWCFSCLPLFAQPQSTASFVRRFGEFAIFPEGRIANALYEQNAILQQDESAVVWDALLLEEPETVLVLNADDTGQFRAQVLRDKEDKWRLQDTGHGVFEVRDRFTGNRQLFREYQQRLQPLMPDYRSVRDPQSTATHTVFYHIRESSRRRGGGRNYTFQVHLLRHSDPEFLRLELYPEDTVALLQVAWVDDTRIRIRFSNGRSQTYDLRDYAPQLFP